jgi:hypothetical protein
VLLWDGENDWAFLHWGYMEAVTESVGKKHAFYSLRRNLSFLTGIEPVLPP